MNSIYIIQAKHRAARGDTIQNFMNPIYIDTTQSLAMTA